MPCEISGSREWTMQRCMLNVHVSLLTALLCQGLRSFFVDGTSHTQPGVRKSWNELVTPNLAKFSLFPIQRTERNHKTVVRITRMTRAVVSLELESSSYYLCPNLEQKEADMDL